MFSGLERFLFAEVSLLRVRAQASRLGALTAGNWETGEEIHFGRLLSTPGKEGASAPGPGPLPAAGQSPEQLPPGCQEFPCRVENRGRKGLM